MKEGGVTGISLPVSGKTVDAALAPTPKRVTRGWGVRVGRGFLFVVVGIKCVVRERGGSRKRVRKKEKWV